MRKKKSRFPISQSPEGTTYRSPPRQRWESDAMHKKAPARAAHRTYQNKTDPLSCKPSSFLSAPPLGCPRKKSCELLPLAPNEPEEFRGSERVHVSTEKSFESPANIRAGPRTQAVSFCGDPVIAQRSEHHSG